MPKKPINAIAVRRNPANSFRKIIATGIVQSGLANCSAIASASSRCVMPQNRHALADAPRNPRIMCRYGRFVRNGSPRSCRNNGMTTARPTIARKNCICSGDMPARPSCLTKIAIMVSVSAPQETKIAPRTYGVNPAQKLPIGANTFWIPDSAGCGSGLCLVSGNQTPGQVDVTPPSTTSICAVTYALSSLAKNSDA